MISKTPNFNKALDEILKNLKPHTRTCQQCQVKFDIFKEDIEFYEKLQVPPPKLCFECRKQRRFGFYNTILKFHKKQDAHTGKKIISTFSPESPYKIYNLKYWWSDKWSGEDYAKNYNSSSLFLGQFQKLNLSVPHQAITHYWKGVVNSPYTIAGFSLKNCYLVSVVARLENVHYAYWVGVSKDCLELLDVSNCENCYELINCDSCYNCHFCRGCEQCIDGYFLYDCRNCQSCFGCAHLRHKSYCFFNKQLSKEEYKEKIKEINLGDRDVCNRYKRKFEELLKKTIRQNLYFDSRNINCVGDHLWHSKNCYYVFRNNYGVENTRYGVDVVSNTKDCMDLWDVGPICLSYETVEAIKSSNLKFTFLIRDSFALEYCIACHNCQYCFACVGIRNKKYHIFNKQYSKEEYYKLLDKIKTKMLESGEYGEFFPLSMSLYPYNNTYAMIEFPLTKKEVLKNGWQWHDEPKISVDLKGLDLIKTKDIPKDIKDVKDDILDKAIICEITNKPFRLIKPELDFYRKHNLPIPTKHPYQRMLERFQKRNPAKLWKTKCNKCGKQILTSYPPKKQKELKIYCKECYNKEVG